MDIFIFRKIQDITPSLVCLYGLIRLVSTFRPALRKLLCSMQLPNKLYSYKNSTLAPIPIVLKEIQE